MTDLTDLGVKAIRDGVAAGDFSAREVAEAFNANVAAAQGALNAFIVTTPEKALKAADAVDAADGGVGALDEGALHRAAGDGEVDPHRDIAVVGDVDGLDHADLGDRAPDLWILDAGEGGADLCFGDC